MKRFWVLSVALMGCPESTPDADPGPLVSDEAGITWHKDVRALVESRCANCHQAGEIGPFELTDYESVYALRDAVAASVASGAMPPVARDVALDHLWSGSVWACLERTFRSDTRQGLDYLD